MNIYEKIYNIYKIIKIIRIMNNKHSINIIYTEKMKNICK